MASPAWMVTKRVPLGRFSPATDGPGPALLGGQGLVVPGRAALGAGPHRPPRTRVSARVPHRLGLETLVPLGARAPPGGDGAWSTGHRRGRPLPSGGAPPDPPGRGPVGPQAMNRSLASSNAARLVAESMPASATMTRSSMPPAAWKASTTGMIVVVSALFPSQQPTWRGNPWRSTSRPTMT